VGDGPLLPTKNCLTLDSPYYSPFVGVCQIGFQAGHRGLEPQEAAVVAGTREAQQSSLHVPSSRYFPLMGGEKYSGQTVYSL